MSKARNIADLGSNDVLDTNANGLDVTGGLTVDNGSSGQSKITISEGGANSRNLVLYSPAINNTNAKIAVEGTTANLDFVVNNGSQTAIRIDGSTGDITFNKDDGTTAGVTFDASTGYTTFDGYVTVNNSVDLNGTLFPNSIFMADSQAIVFGTGSDAELSWGGSYLNLNTKGNDIRIMDGLTTKVHYDASTTSLGIGTDNPDEKLHIKNGALKVEDANNPIIILRDEGNSSNEIGVSGRGAGQDSIYISAYNALANNTYDFKINGATGSIQTRSSLEVGTRIISQQSRINDGTSLAGGMFVEKDVTGSGSSNDITLFADGITNGGNIHLMTGGSAQEKLSVDSSGYVTKPYQPSFTARSPSNGGYSNGGTDTARNLLFATKPFNNGSHYNSTNGRFTAPVTGHYYFAYNILWDDSYNGTGFFSIRKNDSYHAQYSYVHDTGQYGYLSISGSAVVQLNANEWATCYANIPGVHVGGESNFTGFLIG